VSPSHDLVSPSHDLVPPSDDLEVPTNDLAARNHDSDVPRLDRSRLRFRFRFRSRFRSRYRSRSRSRLRISLVSRAKLRQASKVVFADLKNDFVFRRIFAKHPNILRGLLNDLLDRSGDRTIVAIEYLPSEQLPLVAGAKLSILDVRCRDRAGTTFVVEMQLLHVAGFVNRVVYNACKAYADQLKAGDPYTKLTDVIAISICDFVLWPDAKQDAANLPRVPMISRWNMTERGSGNNGLLQVQYAFLELPKLQEKKPETGAELWAWLFVHGPELHEVPPELPQGPHREAVELANEATFTQLELDAYRKVMDEIQQAREYGEAKRAEGHEFGLAVGHRAGLAVGHKLGVAEGHKLGVAEGKRETLLRLLKRADIHVTEENLDRIRGCEDALVLDGWIERVFGAKTIADVLD